MLKDDNQNIEKLIVKLRESKIRANYFWKPMHLQPLYKEFEYYLSNEGDVSQRLFHDGLCLPSGTSLSNKDQEKIIDIILSINP